MTIKQLYEWAKKEKKTDYTIVIRTATDEETDVYEPSIDDLFVWDSTKQVEL